VNTFLLKELRARRVGGSRDRMSASQEQGPEIKLYQHTRKKVFKKQRTTFQKQKA
jgi:hypothetical protein